MPARRFFTFLVTFLYACTIDSSGKETTALTKRAPDESLPWRGSLDELRENYEAEVHIRKTYGGERTLRFEWRELRHAKVATARVLWCDRQLLGEDFPSLVGATDEDIAERMLDFARVSEHQFVQSRVNSPIQLIVNGGYAANTEDLAARNAYLMRSESDRLDIKTVSRPWVNRDDHLRYGRAHIQALEKGNGWIDVKGSGNDKSPSGQPHNFGLLPLYQAVRTIFVERLFAAIFQRETSLPVELRAAEQGCNGNEERQVPVTVRNYCVIDLGFEIKVRQAWNIGRAGILLRQAHNRSPLSYRKKPANDQTGARIVREFKETLKTADEVFERIFLRYGLHAHRRTSETTSPTYLLEYASAPFAVYDFWHLGVSLKQYKDPSSDGTLFIPQEIWGTADLKDPLKTQRPSIIARFIEERRKKPNKDAQLSELIETHSVRNALLNTEISKTCTEKELCMQKLIDNTLQAMMASVFALPGWVP